MLSLRQIPLKNMKAHPVRTVILMVLTMAQVLCIFLGVMMTRSMQQEMTLAQARLGADILIYPTQAMSKIPKTGLLMQGTPAAVYKPRSMLSRLEECENIAAVSYQVYFPYSIEDGSRRWITGFEPGSDFVIRPWLAEGPDKEIPDGSIIAGSHIGSCPDSITLFGKQWPVSAHLLETGSELDEMLFVSITTLKDLISASANAGMSNNANPDPESVYSCALIRVDGKQNVESVTNWINIYIRKVNAIRSEATLTETSAQIEGQIRMIAVIAAAAWLILIFALVIVQSMLMRERRKELYVWFTVGASRGKVNRIMLHEAFLTHLAGSVIGILIGFPALKVFGGNIMTGAMIRPGSTAAAAVITIVLSTAIGCLSAMSAVRQTTQALEGQMLIG